jgi:2-polyprenyl-3-methyl-5-hydroxy-6-metoxy-1,4-benzoquinol methylase
LPSASAINRAVHIDKTVNDGLFHVSTGVEESSELQELPEADELTADRDVFDRTQIRHPRMLADQVPAPRLSRARRSERLVGFAYQPEGSFMAHELQIETNRANWDERVADHLVAYDADAFADDPTANRVMFEAGVMAPHLPNGSLSGIDLVHLQCHIGVDSISLARLGARVVGTDFSGEAIAAATTLAARASVDASFVQTSNEDAPGILDRQFDVVYTSVGVLAWLPDLSVWAQAIERLLKPGGLLFLYESHPMVMTLQYDRTDEALVVTEPYFEGGEARRFDSGTTYASDTVLSNRTTYEWPHSLDEIFSSILNVGLRIEGFHEYTAMPWKPIPNLVSTPAGYALPDGRERLPMMFSLAARKAE